MDAAVGTAKNDDAGERPWALPEGWCWVPLGEIVDIHDHRRRPIKSEERQTRIAGKLSSELFPYYGATGQVGLIDGFLFDFPSILLGEDGAPFLDRQRAKAYAVDGRYWVNNHAHILTPRKSTIGRWLLHALNFIDYEPHVGGTTRLKLTKAELERIPIPLAPLAEQRRIVARIDALFAEIAEGEAALVEARKGLDTFRRALLKAAVTGELTKDWRAANPSDESGQDRLARIAKDRSTKASGKGRSRRNDDSQRLNINALPALPGGWAWATLDALSWASSYGTSVKCAQDAAGVAVLRIPNIREGEIVHRDLKFATTELGLESHDFVSPGDLLVIRTNGSEALIGRGGVCFAKPDQPTYFASYLIRFRLLGGDPMWRWISKFFESPPVRQWMTRQIASSAGQYNVSQSNLAALLVPVPPPSEMVEILRRVSEALAASADTLAMLAAESADGARLKQSILKAAFEGRLVPQDPADEPASALLARLAANPPVMAARRGRARKSNA